MMMFNITAVIKAMFSKVFFVVKFEGFSITAAMVNNSMDIAFIPKRITTTT